LVRRGGGRYVVEVKSGAVAPRVQTPGTRRQLLEYQLAFDVDGILLFDADRRELHEVSFPSPPRALRGTWAGPALALVVAAVIALAYLCRS
jgi:hypothetical protein